MKITIMASLASLKCIRTGVKSRLTRFRQQLDVYESDTGNPVVIKARLERVEKYLVEFNEYQEKKSLI